MVCITQFAALSAFADWPSRIGAPSVRSLGAERRKYAFNALRATPAFTASTTGSRNAARAHTQQGEGVAEHGYHIWPHSQRPTNAASYVHCAQTNPVIAGITDTVVAAEYASKGSNAGCHPASDTGGANRNSTSSNVSASSCSLA